MFSMSYKYFFNHLSTVFCFWLSHATRHAVWQNHYIVGEFNIIYFLLYFYNHFQTFHFTQEMHLHKMSTLLLSDHKSQKKSILKGFFFSIFLEDTDLYALIFFIHLYHNLSKATLYLDDKKPHKEKDFEFFQKLWQ